MVILIKLIHLKIKIYKEQQLCIYHNINIRLFSRYDVENTQVKLIIHVWYAQPDMSATLQKSYGQPHYFQILSTFSYDIWLAIILLTPYGGGLRKVILYEYIYTYTYIYLIHSSIDLK